MITLHQLDELIDQVKAQANADMLFYVSPQRYYRLRWFYHLAVAYHPITRKLRKCHMHKIMERKQREKKKYLQ